jgi:drug/metabolite transporter (DMT)-like permease
MMTRRAAVLAYGAWAAVCFFWGTTYLAIRVAVEELPPVLFAGSRFVVAGAVMFMICRALGHVAPRGRALLDQALVGLALVTVANGIVVWAEQYVPSGLTAVIVAMLPFWMAAIQAVLPRGERIGVRGLLGLVIGFAGLVVLVWPALAGAAVDTTTLVASLLLQVGCLSWAAGSIYSTRRVSGSSPLMNAAVQMLAGGAVTTIAGLAIGEGSAFVFSQRSFTAFAYLVVFGSLVGYGAYAYALAHLPSAFVSLYAYVNPVVAVALGWLLLDERVDARTIAATAMILGGVAIVKSPKRRPAKEPAPETRVEPEISAATACSRTA